MLRTNSVIAGVAVCVMGLGGTAVANEPLDTLRGLVDQVGPVDRIDVREVTELADRVIRTDEIAVLPTFRSAVVGGVQITRTGAAHGLPTTWNTSHVVFGALADPNQWTCHGGGGTTAYTVSCTPNALPVNVSYTCEVLAVHVDAISIGSSGRTSLDCNGDGTPESQTGQTFGPNGYDVAATASATPVTAFTCTLDLAVPEVVGTCGDPGLVGVE